ncbi:MAG: T9SS type A sorting domain-containing protein [Bacteroidia bacterium]|nr:T9SS type A sorting domain-containing protein [Bacteroidia bacterium]
MKKLIVFLGLIVLFNTSARSQCVPTCSSYVLSSITYSTFPTAGNSLLSVFSPNGDDGITGPIPIGFNFNFYCGTYSQVIVGSNGFLTFDLINAINPATSQTSQFFPNTASPNGMVCYYWNDLDPSFGGNVTFTTVGTSPNQMFILTYTDVPIWNTSLLNSGQIILYETTNVIEVHAALISTSPYLGTIGIENLSGTAGVAVTGSNNAIFSATNTAYRWSPAIVGLPPTGVTGNSLICFGDTLSFACNSMSTASSYSWTTPVGWNGSSTTTALTATAGISGNIQVTATYTCGVSAPTNFSVTVNPPPFVSVGTVVPPSLCSGSVAMVNVSGANSYTLEPGSISGTPPFTLIAAANTTYSVTGTSTNGCNSTTPIVVPITVYQSPTVSVNSGSMCLGQTFTFVPTGAFSYSYSTLFNIVTPSAVGNYSYFIIGTATNACTGYAVSSVTVNPVPNPIALASRSVICENEKTVLTVQGANTYSWSNNSAAASQTVTPLSTIIYTVTGTNTVGCNKTATVMVIVNACLGVDGQEKENPIYIYPNPTKGEFNLKVDEDMLVVIFDTNGKEIYKQNHHAGVFQVNLNAYAQGVYLLRAVTTSKEISFRIIKE